MYYDRSEYGAEYGAMYYDRSEYGDGVSYPPNYVHPGTENFLATKPRGALNPIYDPELVSLSRQTAVNLATLRQRLIQQDPCYAYGPEHWHNKQEPPRLFSGDLPQGEHVHGVFTNPAGVSNRRSAYEGPSDEPPHDTESGPVKLCYLCSTLDEHKQHLAKRGPQLKAKPKCRPRVEYIHPPPTVRKKVEEPEEKAEVLYKVIVRTANKPDAGTKANVSVRLRGRRGSMKKKPLTKKLAVSFSFGRGTTETFHIKGPEVGDLKSLIIEHDGLEKKHGWFLEEVEVTNLSTQQTWVFVCKQWISLFHGDFNIRRELPAQAWEVPDMEYEVEVNTGKESMAGTDSNVFITFHGKKGVSPKHALRNKNKDKDNFERGQKDQFFIVTKDNGALSSIRVEHDNTGTGPGWLLERVVVRELLDPGRTYTFPCGCWLARDEGDGDIHAVLYPLRKDRHGRDVILGPGGKARGKGGQEEEVLTDQIMFEVTIVTGTLRYAGTDATIYIKMHGALGIAREMEFKDTNGKRFEKGGTDLFKLKADDVGDIKKLTIHHDNTGMAAGWFCESITMKRYFSKTEIAERLVNMQHEIDENVNRRASEITGEEVDLVTKRRSSLKYKGSTRSDSDSSPRRGDRSPTHRKKTSKHQRHSDSDSEDEEGDSQRQRGRRSSRQSSRSRKSKSALGRISEESDDSAGGHRTSKRDKHRKKTKKISYNGITVLVTDDEDEGIKRKKGKKKSKKSSSSSSSDSSSDSGSSDRRSKHRTSRKNSKYDSDMDNDRKREKSRRKPRRDSSTSDSSSSEDDRRGPRRRGRGGPREPDSIGDEQLSTVWRKDRVPYCDQYVFVCKRWLAEDEDDGQITRTLKPSSITTFYKMSHK